MTRSRDQGWKGEQFPVMNESPQFSLGECFDFLPHEECTRYCAGVSRRRDFMGSVFNSTCRVNWIRDVSFPMQKNKHASSLMGKIITTTHDITLPILHGLLSPLSFIYTHRRAAVTSLHLRHTYRDGWSFVLPATVTVSIYTVFCTQSCISTPQHVTLLQLTFIKPMIELSVFVSNIIQILIRSQTFISHRA